MLGYELREAYLDYMRACDENHAFFSGLKVLSDWYTGVEERLVGVSAGSDPPGNSNSMRSHLGNTAIAMPIKASVFARTAGKMEIALRDLFPDVAPQQNHAWKLADEIQGVIDKFDTYTSEKSPTSALPLVLSARALHVRLGEFQETLGLVCNAISVVPAGANEDEAGLTILFSSVHTVRACWEKLRAVEQIYSEL
jgi:hypothetical protein